MTLFDRVKELADSQGISIAELERKLGLSPNILYKLKKQKPSVERVEAIAQYFNVSIDYLLGRTSNKDTIKDAEGFTEKDRKDIGKRMEEIRKDLTDTDGLMFSGEPLSEEALDSLMDAMEYIVKHTQKVNKKYIPKKYRKEDK